MPFRKHSKGNSYMYSNVPPPRPKKEFSKIIIYVLLFAAGIGVIIFSIIFDDLLGKSAERFTFFIGAFLMVIGITSGISISDKITDRNLNKTAQSFEDLVRSGKYFSGKTWLRKYQDFSANHPVRRLFMPYLVLDLSFRYIKKRLVKYFFVYIFLIPPVFFVISVQIMRFLLPENLSSGAQTWTMILTVTAGEFLGIALLWLLSLRVFPGWLARNPEYRKRIREIRESYKNGYAFTNFYSCAVISDSFVHAYNGIDFYTVPRNMIKKVGCYVERVVTFQRRKSGGGHDEDKYIFHIVFSMSDDIMYKNSIRIPLDQFQVKMIMDVFFPNISDPENIVYESHRKNLFDFEIDAVRKNSRPIFDD